MLSINHNIIRNMAYATFIELGFSLQLYEEFSNLTKMKNFRQIVFVVIRFRGSNCMLQTDIEADK